jgi:hypothetical protein
MKKKSTNYSTPDAGGWRIACDDLFLARFRGRPCAVCGKTESFYQGRTVRSHGHHLLSKELHRLYRYDADNIIVLCPKHHLGAEMSPHSHDVAAQAAFYDWMRENNPNQYSVMMERRFDKFSKELCYREKYVELGGEIASKTGKLKDMRPVGHAKKVRELEEANER